VQRAYFPIYRQKAADPGNIRARPPGALARRSLGVSPNKETLMLKNKKIVGTMLIGSLMLGPVVGCESLPGGEHKQTQGAVIGGVAGAAAGALIAKNNRILGALIGGALGAGGGWLIGSQVEKADKKDDAVKADRRARDNPVTAEEARRATTADINNDGYVTMDEVVAMSKAGLSDDEMIDRLDRTDQFFELTKEQEDYLTDHGVSRKVVTAMRDINADVRQRAYDHYTKDTKKNP
jgi:hypothetical protein